MVTKSDHEKKLHAYTNGTDTIYGESLDEALTAYCLEIGEAPKDYPTNPPFRELADTDELSIRFERADGKPGAKRTKTVGEWIRLSCNDPKNKSRLLCSTEF